MLSGNGILCMQTAESSKKELTKGKECGNINKLSHERQSRERETAKKRGKTQERVNEEKGKNPHRVHKFLKKISQRNF